MSGALESLLPWVCFTESSDWLAVLLVFPFLKPDHQISLTNQSCHYYPVWNKDSSLFSCPARLSRPQQATWRRGRWQLATQPPEDSTAQHSTMVAETNRARKLPMARARAFPSPNRQLPLKPSETELAFDCHWHGAERHALARGGSLNATTQ